MSIGKGIFLSTLTACVTYAAIAFNEPNMLWLYLLLLLFW